MPRDNNAPVPDSRDRRARVVWVVPATLIGVLIGLVFGAIFAAIMAVIVATRFGGL